MSCRIKFTHYLIILINVLLFNQIIHSQVFEWSKQAGGGDNDRSSCISVDAKGNSYVTGFFSGTAPFGTIQLKSAGYEDIFIAKYDYNGNCLWAKQAGGNRTDIGYGIAVDANGNSYVTGNFSSLTATFDSIQFLNDGGDKIFIAKYDSDGNCIWVKQIGAGGINQGMGVSVDVTGNCYVTGCFEGAATFGSIQLTSHGYRDIYVAKYDPNGNCIWANNAGGTVVDYGYSISSDANGNCYITGEFSGNATFGTIQLNCVGNGDIFIAKCDANGNFIWAKRAGGSGEDPGYGISVDANGNSYITGFFYGTATFDTFQLTSAGNEDIFIAKYGPDGNCIWAKQAGGTSYDRSYSIYADAIGNTYITGEFGGNAAFGTYQFSSAGYSDVFIAKYDSNGNCVWAKQASGAISDAGKSVSLDAAGNCFVAGYSTSAMTFGTIQIPNMGLCDIFIAKIVHNKLTLTSPIGNEVWKTNTIHNITWNSNYDGNIKIEITTDNGANWDVVTSSTSAASLQYAWTIPSIFSSNCKIKIEDISDSSISDISDSTFKIWQPVVFSIIPVSGPFTQIFGPTNLELSALISLPDTITSTYYPFESPQGGILPDSVISISNYYWLITAPAVSITNGTVGISLSNLPGVIDTSKLVWLKRAKSGDDWKNIGGIVSNGKLLSTFPFDSFSEFAIGVTTNRIPVELKSFQAISANSQIVLHWQTATELNNFGFEIERCQSISESKTFNYGSWKKIAFIRGNGNSTSPKEYTFTDKQVNGCSLKYRLKQIDSDGKYKYSPEVEIINDIPATYSLNQNYPNPFNPSTVISYQIPEAGKVTVKVYDVVGKEIKTLVNEVQNAGSHSVTFNVNSLSLSSGIYFVKMNAESQNSGKSFNKVIKMMYLK